MSLKQSVNQYLFSWEGHGEQETISGEKVVEVLPEAPTEEIQEEYNRLSSKNLWIEPLVDLFHDELLKRVIEGGTFAISTSWKTPSEWLARPYVQIQVGFDDEYTIRDYGDNIILGDSDVSRYILVNDSFADALQKAILRLILRLDKSNRVSKLNVFVQVRSHEDELQIVGIQDSQNEQDKLIFTYDGRIQSWEGQLGVETVVVEASVNESEEFYIVRTMINGLKDSTYEIVDPKWDEIQEKQRKEIEKLRKQEDRNRFVQKFGEIITQDLERADMALEL